MPPNVTEKLPKASWPKEPKPSPAAKTDAHQAEKAADPHMSSPSIVEKTPHIGTPSAVLAKVSRSMEPNITVFCNQQLAMLFSSAKHE